jgi:hypothetical protein
MKNGDAQVPTLTRFAGKSVPAPANPVASTSSGGESAEACAFRPKWPRQRLSGLKRSPTFAILHSRARYPSGKGEVCKTFIRGFDSHPRLHQIANNNRLQ